jgi:hypothetical protein
LINTIVQSIWLRAFGLMAPRLSGFHLNRIHAESSVSTTEEGMTFEIVRCHSANEGEMGGNHQVCADPRPTRGNVNGAIDQDTAWESISQ